MNSDSSGCGSALPITYNAIFNKYDELMVEHQKALNSLCEKDAAINNLRTANEYMQ